MSTNTALAQLDDHGTTSHEVYTAGLYESSWDFSVRALLGKWAPGTRRRGADVGLPRDFAEPLPSVLPLPYLAAPSVTPHRRDGSG